MDNRTILVLQGTTSSPHDLSPLVKTVAGFRGHMTVLQAGQIPPIPPYAIGSYSISDNWIETRRDIASQLEARVAATTDYLAKQDLSADTGMIYDTAAELGHRIVPHTFIADIAVIMDDLRGEAEAFNNLSYSVIFHSPVPLMLNPTAAALHPERVLVAWNNSLTSARAIHAALPLLKAAKTVTLCSIDPASSDEDTGISIAAWLSHHGCNVTLQHIPGAGVPTADVLLRRATEDGSDLIVMGAYGRSRMQQRFFGGTTRSIIAQTRQAVLLTH